MPRGPVPERLVQGILHDILGQLQVVDAKEPGPANFKLELFGQGALLGERNGFVYALAWMMKYPEIISFESIKGPSVRTSFLLLSKRASKSSDLRTSAED